MTYFYRIRSQHLTSLISISIDYLQYSALSTADSNSRSMLLSFVRTTIVQEDDVSGKALCSLFYLVSMSSPSYLLFGF